MCDAAFASGSIDIGHVGSPPPLSVAASQDMPTARGPSEERAVMFQDGALPVWLKVRGNAALSFGSEAFLRLVERFFLPCSRHR